MKNNRRRIGRFVLGILTAGVGIWLLAPVFAEKPKPKPNTAYASMESGDLLVDGRELFHRNWLPDDPRSPDGDGLGPVFNETSCVGCHNQGAPGGGGPASKNVELLTALVAQAQITFEPVSATAANGNLTVQQVARQTIRSPQSREAISAQLAKIHPGFRSGSSVVIHRFGTSPKHSAWRSGILSSRVTRSFNVPFSLPQSRPFPTPLPANGLFFPTQQSDLKPTIQSTTRTLLRPGSPAFLELQKFNADRNAESTSGPVQQAEKPRAQPRPAPSSDPFGPPQSNTSRVFEPAPGNQLSNAFERVFESLGGRPTPQQTAVLPQTSSPTSSRQSGFSGSPTNLVPPPSRPPIPAQFHAVNSPQLARLVPSTVATGIPNSVIEAAAQRKYVDFPRVSGRVHRLKDGKIGRFGWKSQKATLKDFTLSACANELGLDLPGHAQSIAPYHAKHKPSGHDMNQQQADALVAYVKSLPPPVQQKPKKPKAAKLIDDGELLFESVGCAACHTADMGKVQGVYGDFLLHDLGEKLQASGHYGATLVPHEVPDPAITTKPNGRNQVGPTKKTLGPAPSEWRTPPLWGVRDSAPYLHDGRADTLEQAIAFHGGEASDASIRFFMLPSKKRQQIVAFLKSLRAPAVQTVKRK